MSRNKSPEVTIDKILTISERLFITKGYDKTTIHDIIKELEMSKGAIYYHFKSKEEILDAVIQKQFKEAHSNLVELVSRIQAANGKEKLIKLIEEMASKQTIHGIQEVMINQARNLQLLISGMQVAVQQEAPFFSKIIQEGIDDGSIQTDYPDECAEMFLLLINIWCSPLLFSTSLVKVRRRLEFLQHTMKSIGMDIISPQFIDDIIAFYQELDIYQENNE